MYNNNRGVKGTIVFFAVVGILLGLWHFGIIGKRDEDKIRERLDTFVTAYNHGDYEGILECIEPVRRKQYEAATNIMGGVGSGLLGFNFSISDLVGLGAMFMPEEEKVSLEITRISMLDGGKAIVYARTAWSDVKYTMVKVGRDWYLAI